MALGDNARYKLYPSVRLVRCYLPVLGYAIPSHFDLGRCAPLMVRLLPEYMTPKTGLRKIGRLSDPTPHRSP